MPGKRFPADRRVLREHMFAAVVLLLLLNLCFFPCIWGSKTLLQSARTVPSVLPHGAWAGKPMDVRFAQNLDPGAPGWQTEPWFALVAQEYWHDWTIPLWNPYQGFGRPLAANMQSQAFYPLTFLLSLHLTPRTYSWFILTRLFVAGIANYLYLRFFISFIPALAGGITSMFAGYYMLFNTMPHLSVEILVPASILAAEYMLRRQSYLALVALAFVDATAMLGGMPESTFLLLTLQCLYLAFRILSDTSLRARWLRATALAMAGIVSGISLSAFLLLPFLEFMRNSFDTHQAANIAEIVGLQHMSLDSSAFLYLFPMLLGPVNGAGRTIPIHNYVGVVSIFFIFLSLFWFFRSENDNQNILRTISGFFWAALLLCLLKRYGAPFVNQIGRLPFFSLIHFIKYGEPYISLSSAVLTALGLEGLIKNRIPAWYQAAALGITIGVALFVLISSRHILVNSFAGVDVGWRVPALAIGVPVILLLCSPPVLFLLSDRNPSHARNHFAANTRLGCAMLVIIALELSFNYIVPTYYSIAKMASASSNPYAGAPFVTFLKNRSGRDRIFARETVLFPDWSSPFGLFDIRDLDAMYYKKYFPFLLTFFPQPTKPGKNEEFGDRFRGIGDFNFQDFLSQRALQLSSVRYVATITPYYSRNDTVEEILKQNQGHLIPGRGNLISRKAFLLDGAVEEGLGEHPPYERLSYRVKVGDGKLAIFHFAYALDPAVFKASGDGVDFTLEAKDETGKISKLFTAYIDPKHNPSERRWLHTQVNLSSYAGQWIELLFSTDPGPKGDSNSDWAAWGDLHFEGEENEHENKIFRPVYHGAAWVYEYPGALPRASVYYHAAVTNSEADVLTKLADKNLDVTRDVVLDASKLTPEQTKAVAEINSAPPTHLEPAVIRSYKPDSAEIEISSDRPGVLVLNDTAYPGWKVEVDEKTANWFPANYLFRAVILKRGKHVVRFTYRPSSFRLGASISAVTFLGLLFFGLYSRRQTRMRSLAQDSGAQSINLHHSHF